MDNQQDIAKLRELIKGMHSCMLTTMTTDGRHVSRPMGVQQFEFDGDFWFFTYVDSNKISQITSNPQVNLAFSNEGASTWVSISGTAEVVSDPLKSHELWNPFLNAWFPDGLETPGITLFKVHAESAEYWNSVGGKAVQLFRTVKAIVTGDVAQLGENESMELEPPTK